MAGGVHGKGACVRGGMHGRGVHGGGHAWQGGMCGRGVCVMGGMHGGGRGGMRGRYYEIRLMSRRYASYWNAFLFLFSLLKVQFTVQKDELSHIQWRI